MGEIYIKSPEEIVNSLGLQEGGEIYTFFTKSCATHMDKYVPMQRGDLAKYSLIENNTAIEYGMPYAHYQYRGKVMGPNIPIKVDGVIVKWFSKKPKYYTGADIVHKTTYHKKAGPFWDIRMVVNEKEELVAEVQREVNRRCK